MNVIFICVAIIMTANLLIPRSYYTFSYFSLPQFLCFLLPCAPAFNIVLMFLEFHSYEI
jgi:hypothetical protein